MDAALEIGLRVELSRLVGRAGRRRVIAPVCFVGHPAGEQAALPDAAVVAGDPGLRADLVVRALDGLEHTETSCAWLTRSGDLHQPTDADAAWFAAAQTGFGRHGVPLAAFVVLNRTGWTDLVSGSTRTWSRVRPLPTWSGAE